VPDRSAPLRPVCPKQLLLCGREASNDFRHQETYAHGLR
jgi:hypothetical protein